MKLSNAIWIFPLFIVILLSCQQEGNWTAVKRSDLYIYGVWKAPTSKNAKQAIADVSASIQTQLDAQAPTKIATTKEGQTHPDPASNEPKPNSESENVYIPRPYLTTDAPEHLLPQNSETADWVRSRPITTYDPDTLYKDRAVDEDIYLNYGFQKQAEMEYQSPKFGSVPYVLLEIFDMGTPENAFGIFSVYSYPQPKYEWVGCKAIVSGKYLRFWKGKYFIQIEGYAIATGIQDGMVTLAKATAKHIQDPPQKIPLLETLPIHYIRSSEKLFFSNWTLRKVYKTAPDIIPQLTDGAIGVLAQDNTYSKNPKKPCIIFVLRFPNIAEAESAWTQYHKTLKDANLLVKKDKKNGIILIDEEFAQH